MPLLNFSETKKMLLEYNIPLVETELVNSLQEAKNSALKIGYPIALKVFSLVVFHRTEQGLVKLGVKDERGLNSVFNELLRRSKKIEIEGILVQKMVGGFEIVCGMKRDAVFGPVIMFGLGGIFVEIIKDVSFGIVPVSQKEAMEMIKETKGCKILQGYRGSKPANLDRIVEIILKTSRMAIENENIKEIDFNPIFVNGSNIMTADAKIII